jgi:hypothetical protein
VRKNSAKQTLPNTCDMVLGSAPLSLKNASTYPFLQSINDYTSAKIQFSKRKGKYISYFHSTMGFYRHIAIS